MKKVSNKKFKEKIPRYKYLIATLISVFLVAVPLISRLKIHNINEEYLSVFPSNNGILIDFFLHYKEIFIIGFATIVVLFFIGEIIFPDKRIMDYPLRNKNNKIILISILVFIIGVILSAVLSKYKDLVVMGSPLDADGALTLIAYMVLLMAGINYFNNKKSIKILKNALLILIGIIVLLGFLEITYKPIFEIPFFKSFLAGSEYKELLNTMENRDFKDMISITFYNPNYLGSACVLLFPIAFVSAIKDKKVIAKIISAILTVGMFIITIATKSTAPLYIVFLEIAVIILYYRKEIIKNKKATGAFIVISLTIFIGINLFTENKIVNLLKESIVNAPSIYNPKEKFLLEDLDINNNTLTIVGKEEVLNITIEDTSNINEIEAKDFTFTNKENQKIDTAINDKEITFNNEAFKAVTITNLSYGIVVDIGYNDTMEFYITDEGFKGVGQNGVPIDNITKQNNKFKAFYSIATGRGYVWFNSLDLLKKSILLGTGPTTFPMVIQQHDYVGLMNTHGSAKFIIDKPHNMYIQIAVQVGGVALLALIIIFFITIKRGFKKYKIIDDEQEDQNSPMGVSILIGVIGFLIISLVNDSIVTVAPIFWVLLGVNISMTEYV